MHLAHCSVYSLVVHSGVPMGAWMVDYLGGCLDATLEHCWAVSTDYSKVARLAVMKAHQTVV